jgi:hypothetical protein
MPISRHQRFAVEEASRAAGTITTEIKDRIRRRQAIVDVPLHFINREAVQWLVDYHRSVNWAGLTTT